LRITNGSNNGLNNGSNNGLRSWYWSFNLDNQRLDVFGASVISRRHRREEVVGIVGPLYAFPLRVVIPFKSSFGLVMVLLGRVPEPKDEASQLAVEESGLDEPELGNPRLDKPMLDKLEDIDQMKAYNVPMLRITTHRDVDGSW
nr:hypothetical protein [Tanacetum cinerariifolium]